MSVIGSFSKKISEYMGWSSSGAYLSPTGEDRLGIIPEELTPETVARAVQAASDGNLGMIQECYMKMIATDSHIRGELGTLGMAVSDYPLRVSVAKTDSPQAQEAAEMMEEVLTNPRLKTRQLIRSMARVHFHGVRVYESDFEVEPAEGGMVMLNDLLLVPPPRLKMEMRHTEDDYGGLRITDRDEPEGRPVGSYPEGSITVVTDGEEDGFWDLGGAGRTCLFWYCAKHFNAKWWSEFNETYGEPARIGYYDPWSDDEDRAQMRDFLQQLGRAAWAMMPSTQEFEFMSPEMGQVKTHEDLIHLADNQMSKAIVGQIGTSGREEHGSYGEVTELNSVRYEIVKAVAGMIEESLHPLVYFLCRANVDPDFPIMEIPRVYIVVPNPEEKKVKADLFRGALQMGMEIPRQHAYDELGIPMPADGDDVLAPDELPGAQSGPEAGDLPEDGGGAGVGVSGDPEASGGPGEGGEEDEGDLEEGEEGDE